MSEAEFWLIVGHLVAAQGLNGEIRVNPKSDFPERFTKPGKRWLQRNNIGEPREVELVKGRQLPGKGIYVVKFAGVNSRNKAEELIGQALLVPSSNRPTLKDGEFHLLDLVGVEVRLAPTGAPIGHVTNLLSGGNDLLEIKLLEGRNVLVPFVEAIVPEICLEERWIALNPPPGLLEL